MHTVPHRDGTIQSFGSLSVNAIRLRRHVSLRIVMRDVVPTLVRLPTRVSCGGRGLHVGAGSVR
jgi:hypothetical protein